MPVVSTSLPTSRASRIAPSSPGLSYLAYPRMPRADASRRSCRMVRSGSASARPGPVPGSAPGRPSGSLVGVAPTSAIGHPGRPGAAATSPPPRQVRVLPQPGIDAHRQVDVGVPGEVLGELRRDTGDDQVGRERPPEGVEVGDQAVLVHVRDARPSRSARIISAVNLPFTGNNGSSGPSSRLGPGDPSADHLGDVPPQGDLLLLPPLGDGGPDLQASGGRRRSRRTAS